MISTGSLKQLSKPFALRFRVGWKVEYDRDPFQQERTNVWPKRVLQSRRTFDVSRYISDFSRKQVIQEFVLNQENGRFLLGQIFRKGGFPCRHFAAHENQLSWNTHMVLAQRQA